MFLYSIVFFIFWGCYYYPLFCNSTSVTVIINVDLSYATRQAHSMYLYTSIPLIYIYQIVKFESKPHWQQKRFKRNLWLLLIHYPLMIYSQSISLSPDSHTKNKGDAFALFNKALKIFLCFVLFCFISRAKNQNKSVTSEPVHLFVYACNKEAVNCSSLVILKNNLQTTFGFYMLMEFVTCYKQLLCFDK